MEVPALASVTVSEAKVSTHPCNYFVSHCSIFPRNHVVLCRAVVTNEWYLRFSDALLAINGVLDIARFEAQASHENNVFVGPTQGFMAFFVAEVRGTDNFRSIEFLEKQNRLQ